MENKIFRRKSSQIARWCHQHTQILHRNFFSDSHKTSKFVKVFSLKNFTRYGNVEYLSHDMTTKGRAKRSRLTCRASWLSTDYWDLWIRSKWLAVGSWSLDRLGTWGGRAARASGASMRCLRSAGWTQSRNEALREEGREGGREGKREEGRREWGIKGEKEERVMNNRLLGS